MKMDFIFLQKRAKKSKTKTEAISTHLGTFLTRMDLMLLGDNMTKRAITSDPLRRTSRAIITMILRIMTSMTTKRIKSRKLISWRRRQ
jgi:hypothetical protein